MELAYFPMARNPGARPQYDRYRGNLRHLAARPPLLAAPDAVTATAGRARLGRPVRRR